ncbi:uncharacterized protein LOC122404311 [Colletes gigas]|uniref:uncharacterized protein LOC122404311 n=1 Tax=Colletes gigas TaxID=935657 RepID=UPI001C9B8D6A|nr:uncharacterized protein LOC122404311 [Colletes gigas]
MAEIQQTIPIELPKMRLEKFDGDPTKWEHFEDLFTAGVITNPTLTDVQRLQYLNTCITGRAAAAIASLAITDSNFSVAWSTLKAEFGLPRLVLIKLLDRILRLTKIRKGDLSSVQQVTIGFRQALAILAKKGTVEEQLSWLLTHIVASQFDAALQGEWQRSLKMSTEYPSLEEIMRFLDQEARAMTVIDEHNRKPGLKRENKPPVRSHNAVVESSPTQRKCTICGQTHALSECGTFKRFSTRVRYQIVKFSQGCIACLALDHDVRGCRSQQGCSRCGGRHHALLHFEQYEKEAGSQTPKSKFSNGKREERRDNAPPQRRTAKAKASTDTSNAQAATSHCTASTDVPRPVLLATAIVRVYGENGASHLTRALLDQGSETSFISAKLRNDLNLPRKKTSATVSGLGGGRTQKIKYSVGLNLGTASGVTPVVSARAYVVTKITNYASPSVNALDNDALRNLKLADPEPASGQNIEVLIGADLYAQVIRSGFRRISPEGPIAQETAFGWILSGPIDAASKAQGHVRTLHCNIFESLDHAIRRFWEIEEIPSTSVLTKAEEECEAHFQKTVARDATGRFIVRLPFNHPKPEGALGDSLRIALSALTRLRRKLDKDQTLVREYQEFLTEYESLEHMTRIEPSEKSRLYIPHRAVIRTESATTKLRVVFNATSRIVGGQSINDILHVGPKLQNDITFTELKAFELNTVTYGTACEPYLSMRTLLELKKRDGDRFPLAASILEKDIYVDDVFMGAPDTSLLEKIRIQVCELLQGGGFQLRKWAGNLQKVLRNIPQSSHSHAVDLTLFNDSELKVLGLRWIPSGNYFCFNPQRFQPAAGPITKRTLFSEIAKLYDPLGWLSPVVIRAKMLMQSQWLEKIQWDDHVSANTLKTWNTFCEDWGSLEKVTFPRWIRYGADAVSVELHGFCDASLGAYSAVTYLRVTTMTEEVFTTLIMAKTRVAPIKT